MDKQALNRKLAKWAGINIKDVPILPNDCYFTDSLDACFKWLVPNLRPKHDIVLTMFSGQDSTQAEIHTDGTAEWVHVREHDAALALCLAIEKLIDGGK